MEPDEEGEPGAYGSPPDPTERTWLHPSEFGKLLHPHPSDPARRRAGSDRMLPLAIPLLAGMVGAALMLGFVAVTGNLRRTVTRPVVTRVQTGLGVLASDPDAVAEVAANLADQVLSVHVDGPTGTRTGSAVAYRSDGHLLTNHRLVDNASSIDVFGADGKAHSARVVGGDPDTDLAMLVVDGDHPPVATIGHAAGLRVGQLAIVVGASPTPGTGSTVSAGVISRLGQAIPIGTGSLYDMIATNAVADSWLTGGALVTRDGALVGIVIVPDPGQPALAVPIDVARRVADEIFAFGRVRHAWLGLQAIDLDPHTARDYGVAAGALVREVTAGSPAQKAGMEMQDVITAIDADHISSTAELMTALRHHLPGETVSVGYVRSGKERTVKMVLADRP